MTTTRSAAMGDYAPLLGRVVQVRREEVAALLWSFAYFFCHG